MRWPSAFELRQLLRRHGFDEVRLVGFHQSDTVTRGFARHRGDAYAIGARARG
jgi:hypothetical protein